MHGSLGALRLSGRLGFLRRLRIEVNPLDGGDASGAVLHCRDQSGMLTSRRAEVEGRHKAKSGRELPGYPPAPQIPLSKRTRYWERVPPDGSGLGQPTALLCAAVE